MKPKKLIVSALLTIGLLTSLVSTVEHQQLSVGSGSQNPINEVDPQPWVMNTTQEVDPQPWVLSTNHAVVPQPGVIYTPQEVDPQPWV